MQGVSLIVCLFHTPLDGDASRLPGARTSIQLICGIKASRQTSL